MNPLYRTLATLAVLLMATAASAATITVTTLDDERNADGDCSLREAVESANRNTVVDACTAGEAGDDEITFSAALLGGTLTFNRAAIEVTEDVSINGATAPGFEITIAGADTYRLFTVTSDTLSLSNLFLSGGRSVSGGAVYVGSEGALSADDVTFFRNEATGADATNGGAAIYNDGGWVSLTDCEFEQNNATGAAGSGGAVFNNAGTLMAMSTTFTDNSANRAGGAIEARGGTTTLVDTDFDRNDTGSAPGNGGAFHISGSGSASITNGTVTNNTATAEGGGFWNNTGTMTISGTVFTGNIAQGDDADNGGGALYNNGGRMEVVGATITDNEATGISGSGGGILNNGGRLIVMSSTVSRNIAPRAGGGVEDASGTTVLIMSTFEENAATANANPGNGGAVHSGGGTVVVAGGTFADNDAVQGGGLWTSGTLVITSNEKSIPNGMMPGTTMPAITPARITGNDAIGNDGPGAGGPDGGGGLYATPSGTILVFDATIDGNTASGTSGSGGGILSGGDLTLRNVTVSNNTANRAGGGIEDAGGTATLVDVMLMGNAIDAAMPGNGGGLHSGGGSVFITRSVISGNSAVEGGGLWANGTLTINGGAGPGDADGDGQDDATDDDGNDRSADDDAAVSGDRSGFTVISGNDGTGDAAGKGGGGIYVATGGQASIRYATIDGNTASGTSGSGGGILVEDGASAVVMLSEVTRNTANRAGGGIELFDDAGTTGDDDGTSVTIRMSTIDSNRIDVASPGNGGGIHAGGAGEVMIIQSTVSNNDANEGGGVWIAGAGSADIENSTVSGNTSTADGGGVYDDGGAEISLSSTTVFGNTAGGDGGGIVSQGTTFRFQNTIVGGNSSGDEGPDCLGTFRSGDYNLVESLAECILNGTTDNTITGASPRLNPLADNGGFTMTHAPMSNSVVINAGQSAFAVDQRGLVRDERADASAQDDIGSVELNARPVAGEDDPDGTATLAMQPMRPNPAIGRATIAFTVTEAAPTRVELFNVLGQRVLTAYDGTATPGQEITVNVDLATLAAGVYLVRLESGGQMTTQQVTIVR